MARSVEVSDVLAPKPTPGTLLRRGVAKRCPRCGAKGIFDSWFHQKERCPDCGYLFEREPGFFVGAYLINFAIAEGLLFVLLMGYIAWRNANSGAGVVVPVVVGLLLGVLGPVVFYPYSRTIWSAFDLLMTPLEVSEIVEAADAVGGTAERADGTADAPDGSGEDDEAPDAAEAGADRPGVDDDR